MFLAALSRYFILMGWVSTKSLDTVKAHSTSTLIMPNLALVLLSPHQGLYFFHYKVNFVSD